MSCLKGLKMQKRIFCKRTFSSNFWGLSPSLSKFLRQKWVGGQTTSTLSCFFRWWLRNGQKLCFEVISGQRNKSWYSEKEGKVLKAFLSLQSGGKKQNKKMQSASDAISVSLFWPCDVWPKKQLTEQTLFVVSPFLCLRDWTAKANSWLSLFSFLRLLKDMHALWKRLVAVLEPWTSRSNDDLASNKPTHNWSWNKNSTNSPIINICSLEWRFMSNSTNRSIDQLFWTILFYASIDK